MNQIQFAEQLAKVGPSATFLYLKNYKDSHGNISNYKINFHINYVTAIARSKKLMSNYTPQSQFERRAKAELLESFEKSLSYPKVDDTYINILPGIKMHKEDNTIYVYGLVVEQTPIVKVSAPPQRNPYQQVKHKLRSQCPVGKFRQFIISKYNVEKITVGKMEISPGF
jgi:hypothetical protein